MIQITELHFRQSPAPDFAAVKARAQEILRSELDSSDPRELDETFVMLSQRNLFCCLMAMACLAFALALTPLAAATEPMLTSPEGFSITPPDGWTVVSKNTAQQMAVIRKFHTIHTGFPDERYASFETFAEMLTAVLHEQQTL